MESAIPRDLQEKRTCPHHKADKEYLPPFPAWTSRFENNAEQFVVVYFAIQSLQSIHFDEHRKVTQYFQKNHLPEYWVPSTYRDHLGFYHLVVTMYWSSTQVFEAWFRSSGFEVWWKDKEREAECCGYFLEVYYPKISEFEMIFSDPKTPEGLAHLAKGMSGEIQEHGYHGSMRDRLPIAQTHLLQAESITTESRIQVSKKRIQIKGKENLSLIRSGQDWSHTVGNERNIYLKHVEPILRHGMNFLAHDGKKEGCLSCRYMRVLDKDTGDEIDKTFGLAHFKDLKHLENWAKSHETHTAIFAEFMSYVREMQFNISLKLFHEVMVLPAKSQYYEYIACHSKTGMLQDERSFIQ